MIGGLFFQFIGAFLRLIFNQLVSKEKKSFDQYYNGEEEYGDAELIGNDARNYFIGFIFLLSVSIIIVSFSLKT